MSHVMIKLSQDRQVHTTAVVLFHTNLSRCANQRLSSRTWKTCHSQNMEPIIMSESPITHPLIQLPLHGNFQVTLRYHITVVPAVTITQVQTLKATNTLRIAILQLWATTPVMTSLDWCQTRTAAASNSLSLESKARVSPLFDDKPIIYCK